MDVLGTQNVAGVGTQISTAHPPIADVHSGVNQRGAIRGRVRLPAKIVFGGRTFALDCTIRDLSATGARVALPNPDILQDRLVLIEPESMKAFEATIRWRRSNLVGLFFGATINLDGEMSLGDQALRMYALRARADWGY